MWENPHGFECRRTDAIATENGKVCKVTSFERINGRFRPSGRFHAYVDGAYVGHSATIDGAKLACQLHLYAK